MPKDDMKSLMDLERENARLKLLLAEKELDNSILREVAPGKYGRRSRGCAPPSSTP